MAALLALLSSLSWGTADFLGGLVSRRRPALAVYGATQVVGLVCLAAVAVATGAWRAPAGYWPWAVAAGVIGMVGMVSFYAALAIGPMGIVSPAAALAVLVPLAVGLLTGESPTPVQVLGIVAAVVGILLASGPEFGDAASARPLLLALLTAGMFGVMFVLMARGSEVDAVMTMTGMRVTTVTVVVVLVAVRLLLGRRRLREAVGGLTAQDATPLVAVGVLDAGANLLWGVASTMGLLSVTSVLGSLYPVVTAVLAGVVLHERLRAVQYAGVAAALTGVALISAGG